MSSPSTTTQVPVLEEAPSLHGAGGPLEAALAGAARGDRLAMERVYDLTSASVFRLLRALLEDAEVTGPAVMRTYVAIWRLAPCRPTSVSARAWVMGVAARSAALPASH